MGRREGEGGVKSRRGPQPTHQLPEAGPYIEGDGQREEVGGEVAEDAFQVVQVAPTTVAVGVGPDKVTAVRSVQAAHVTTLQKGKGGRTSGV